MIKKILTLILTLSILLSSCVSCVSAYNWQLSGNVGQRFTVTPINGINETWTLYYYVDVLKSWGVVSDDGIILMPYHNTVILEWGYCRVNFN